MGQAELMTFNILIIGQSGRLQYEAIMFLASLRQSAPDYKGQVFVAVPLVIHSFGGGWDALEAGYLDGAISCHYRLLPSFYARESDLAITTLETAIAPNKIKKVVKAYEPIRRMVYQKRGAKVRALFDQNNLPRKEQQIRNTLKRAGFWMR